MNRPLNIMCLSLAILFLTGCFPSERMYVVNDCGTTSGLCGFMPNNSEFAFVKQANGSKYEIWVNQKPNVNNGPMLVLSNCEAPVENGKFKCDFCGAPGSFRITKTSGSGCGFAKCVKIEAEEFTPKCPAGGTGTGGHN